MSRLRILYFIPLLFALSAAAAAGDVKVLDDFEGGAIRWTGDYSGSIVAENATHGDNAFKVVFPAGREYPGITASRLDLDWSGFDTLRMDVYNPQPQPVNLIIKIADPESGGTYSGRYNGELLIVNGQTHLAIPFSKITASGRPLDFAHIQDFTIFMASPPRDTTLYFDNIRLTKGEEPADSRGRDIGTEALSKEVEALRGKAEAARARLSGLVALAHDKGIGTLEPNIALITAQLGIDVRPDLPWYAGRKAELYDYVVSSCNAAADSLQAVMEGKRTQSPVPPVPSTANLEVSGPYLVEKDNALIGAANRPVLIFSMLYHRSGPLCEYFTPVNYFAHSNAFAGASRYDVESTPLYQAFRKFPDTHRVWNDDEGWCGHIVRDSSSMGGGSEPVVVCLESPHTLAAIDEYIAGKSRAYRQDRNLLLDIMGGELSYICYCPETLRMFRTYLQEQYKSIEALNDTWGTRYKTFFDVTVMPNARQADENRARWYDWQAFNCKRFVDHAVWSKEVAQKYAPDLPVAAGAVSYSFRTDFGRSGVDEEMLVRKVDGIVLNEAGPSTIATDLLWSFSGTKPMCDFEYHGDIAGILPHFLHGNTMMAMWWWPDKVDTEFPQFNETALPYSWNIPLADVAEALKTGLDVRRLSGEIAAFPRAKADMAILYSRASMLQVPAKFLGGKDSPYTLELQKTYNAMLGLDAPVRFVSSIQVREGRLADYKVLVVPAAAYVFDDVAQAIFAFAQDGGTVVITPESLLYDEHAKAKDRLSRLGIRIESAVEPAFAIGATGRDAFLQGMVAETTEANVPSEKVTFSGDALLPKGTTLAGRGVFQTVSASPSTVIAATADGKPAVLDVKIGKGRVYYLATPLDGPDMNAFLDAAAAKAGVARQARFTVAGKRDWRIEARSVPAGDAMLFYVVNHGADALDVTAALPKGFVKVTDLRDPQRAVDLSRITVEPGRTRIFAAAPEGAR